MFVVSIALLTGLLSIPAVNNFYLQMLHVHLPPSEMPLLPDGIPIAYMLLSMIGGLPNIPSDGVGALEGFMRRPEYARAGGAYDGPGLRATVGQANGWALVRESHQANKDMYMDPTTTRQHDLMISINTTIAASYFAPGVQPTLLSVGTSEPIWWQTRDLWTATIPALQRYPAHVPDLVFPPWEGQTEAKFCESLVGFNPLWTGMLKYGDPSILAPRELGYLVAYNFNKQLFGTEITQKEADMISELLGHIAILLAGAATGTSPPESVVTRGLEIQEAITNVVLKNDWSKGFLAEAKKRGMDGMGKLRSLLLSFIVAGQATPGTTFYAMWVINKLNSDRKNLVPLYEKDPEAFNLEVVRLFGAGGANSNFHAPKTTDWKMPTGKVIRENKGTLTATNLFLAGFDPNVWGGPSKSLEHAKTFIPGRENREQVISWMNELGDIRKCPNMTGCDAAPRFCPGAELTQRLTKQVVDFYIKTCVKTSGTTKKDEM